MKKSISIPSIPDDEVTGSELTHTAFLSHEGTEKRTVLHLLCQELHERGIPKEEVFYDKYMKLGGNIDANPVRSLTNGLLASRCMILFLTPDFVKKRWPMWELKTFLEMMGKDRRRKLLPVFYRLSAEECGSIAEQALSEELKWKLGPAAENKEVRVVMGKVKEKFGIDAQGLRLSDPEVVTRIMKDAFKIDISNDRIKRSIPHKAHDIKTCEKPFCEHPICSEASKSELNAFFATPSLPMYSRFDFENSKRPEKMLRQKLLLKGSKAVAAVGVRGMGGVGKTTCLIGVANDLQVRDAFPDGVLWIQLSRETNFKKLREIFVNILKHAWYHWEIQNAEVALNPRTSLDDIVKITQETLREKRCLLVVDDFWPFDDFESSIVYFRQILNQSSRILLSTRYSEVVDRFTADEIDVGDLDDSTASALFDDWCGETPSGEEEKNLKQNILELCSNVALAVCIAGSNVRRIARGDGKEHGMKRVLGKLKGNIGSLQKLVHTRNDRMLIAVIQTTIDSMKEEDDKNGYQHLAVFNSKTRIPSEALEVLWDLNAESAEDRVDLYVSCSLATCKVIVKSGCRSSFYVEFHDQHLAYARYSWCLANKRFGAGRSRSWEEQEEEMLRTLHTELVDGYRELHRGVSARVWWEAEQLNDGYFHENYAHHLAKSGRMKDLVELLMDYRWIALRFRKRDITGLLEDFDLAISALRSCQTRKPLKGKPTGFGESSCLSSESSAADDTTATHNRVCDALLLAQKALQKSQPILSKRRGEVPFQLVGRLRAHSRESALIKKLIDSARRWERGPWLWPVSECFESPMSAALQVLPTGSVVRSVAVVSEKRHLVGCGTFGGHVCLWDWRTGRRVWSQKYHKGSVCSLAATRDGGIMVSGSQDKTVRIWNVESGECRKVLLGHECSVSSVAVTAEGRVVVSGGSWDKTIRIWNVESGGCEKVLLGHESQVSSVTVTKDGSVMVSGSEDGTVRIWNVESRECNKVLSGHEGSVSSVAVTEDGRVVVSGGLWDKTVRIWNVESGECNKVLLGHEFPVISVAVMKDGRVVVSGGLLHKTVRIWNVESGECNKVFLGPEGPDISEVVIKNGRVRVSDRWSGKTVRIWNGESGECNKVLLGHDGSVSSVTVTEDGGVVVSDGSWDGTIRIWNMESGECKKVPLGHERSVSSVAVTEDGRVVVSGSQDRTIRIWNVESGVCKKVLLGHEGPVSSVAVTEDGRAVVSSGSWDRTIRIWNVESGVCKKVFLGHESSVESVAVTENGKIVVPGSCDMTVRIWNLASGECKRVFLGHKKSVNSVAVTEDGSIVVSGSYDKTVRIWNVASGECKRVLRGHDGSVNSVAVAKNGSFVVSGSDDKTIRIWSVASGECFRIVTDSGDLGYFSMLTNRELLRWARSLKLLPSHGEAGLGDSGCQYASPGGCKIRVASGVLKIARDEDGGTVMSATFDSAVRFALAVNLNGNRKVVVVTILHVLILDVMEPEHLEKEIGLIGEAGDG